MIKHLIKHLIKLKTMSCRFTNTTCNTEMLTVQLYSKTLLI